MSIDWSDPRYKGAYTTHCITCAEATARAEAAEARVKVLEDAKLDGVRAGIEAAVKWAKDDLIAADADMIDYVPLADSDGDDGS